MSQNRPDTPKGVHDLAGRREEESSSSKQALDEQADDSRIAAGDGSDGPGASASTQLVNDEPNLPDQASEPPLGNLHKRRASASPDKFNTGAFQPLPLRTSAPNPNLSPSKKQRLAGDQEINKSSNVALHPAFHLLAEARSSTSQDYERSNAVLAGLGGESGVISSPLVPPTAIPTTAKLIHNPNAASSAQPTQRKKFNLMSAFLRHPDLLVHLVSCLNLSTLISLYAISKPFHYYFNKNETAFILASMRTWAPRADVIFPWRCYKALCIKDPNQRLSKLGMQRQGVPLHTYGDQFRDVPTLRWLQMVVWRQGVCQDMLIQLAVKGLLCPPGTLEAIKRMWLLLDMPLNEQRNMLIRNRHYFSEQTLDLIMHFLLKVDMHFTDPIPPDHPANHPDQRRYPNSQANHLDSGVTLRKTLLAESSLTPLWRVIHGWTWDPSMGQFALTRVDILRLWARHYWTMPAVFPDSLRYESVLGIPWWELGTAGLERTGHAISEVDGARRSWVNPHILGPGCDPNPHRRQQLAKKHELKYPGRARMRVPGEQPRQRLLPPDELVLTESVRRGTQPHKRWVEMMLYGFCDDLGRTIPLKTEEMYRRLSKGLPALPEEEMKALKEKHAEKLRAEAMKAAVEGSASETDIANQDPSYKVSADSSATPGPSVVESCKDVAGDVEMED